MIVHVQKIVRGRKPKKSPLYYHVASAEQVDNLGPFFFAGRERLGVGHELHLGPVARQVEENELPLLAHRREAPGQRHGNVFLPLPVLNGRPVQPHEFRHGHF